MGPRARSPRARRSCGAACAATRPGRTRSRPRSTRCTATPRSRPTPTGARSCSSTTSCSRSRRARWWRSTARWPSPSSRARSPALAVVDALDLDGYHLFHSTRADLLARLGRNDDARAAYDRAPRAHQQRRRALVARAQARGAATVRGSRHEVPFDGRTRREDGNRHPGSRRRRRRAGYGQAATGPRHDREAHVPHDGRADERAVPDPAERGASNRGRRRGR